MLSYSPLGFHICMCMYMLVTFLLFESNQNKYKNFWDKEKRRNFYFEYDLLLLWIIWLVSSGFNGFVIVKISFQIKANQFFFIFLCPFPCYDQITNQKRNSSMDVESKRLSLLLLLLSHFVNLLFVFVWLAKELL